MVQLPIDEITFGKVLQFLFATILGSERIEF